MTPGTSQGTSGATPVTGTTAKPELSGQVERQSGGSGVNTVSIGALDVVAPKRKVELSETTVMARNGSMVAYQGDVRFEHKGAGLGRLLKKAATGEALRLMQASGSGELFLASNAMLVHVLTLHDDSLTVNGQNILAFEAGIDWDVTRVKGGSTGMLAGGLFNIQLRGTGLVALLSDGEPLRLDVAEAPTFVDPQAAIAWSGGVSTNLKTDMQAKSLIGMGREPRVRTDPEGLPFARRSETIGADVARAD